MIAAEVSSLFGVERGELIVDSGLTYDGITPVLVRVTKREGRYEFSDDGAAVKAAGVDSGLLAFGRRIVEGDHSVNVSRQGVVWLPAVERRDTEWLAALPGFVAAGSCALYEALLELDE